MATKAVTASTPTSSSDILNAVRNAASANFRDLTQPVTSDLQSIRELGATIMGYSSLQNEFLSVLVNRIGMVLLTNKMYKNPWTVFKRGMLDYGETVEEVFVELARPFEYDPAVAESEVFKREIPDVRSAFHILNYQKFYKTTVSREQLRQAFLSQDGILNLVTKITESLYTAAEYDEFQVMKYLLAKNILNGRLYPAEINADGGEEAAVKIKAMSNSIEFMKSNYNLAGVHTRTLKEEQYLIMNAGFQANISVKVLAAAFNMSEAEFMGHQILVDSFGDLDTARLNELFKNEEWYEEIGTDDMKALDAIPAVLVDKDYFMILDNLFEFKDKQNEQGLYWNYFYHTWKTFSVSPFANAVMFLPAEPSVVSVKVTPEAVTAGAGQTVQLAATVETKNFAPKAVSWSMDETLGTVDIYGKVKLAATASGSVVVTATSVFDGTKSGKCTITVS